MSNKKKQIKWENTLQMSLYYERPKDKKFKIKRSISGIKWITNAQLDPMT